MLGSIILHRPLIYTENVFGSIPLHFWLFIFLNSLLITYIILFKYTTEYLLILTGLMYCLLFYVSNLYFIIPFEQTDAIPYESIIENKAVKYSSYFASYPITLGLYQYLHLITGIGKIEIYTVSLFTLLIIFYVGLYYFYRYENSTNPKLATIYLSLYVIMSYYVINDQFAPQTLALVFLPYMYRLTINLFQIKIDPNKSKKFLLLFILYIALIFTHPFMFLFFLLPFIGLSLIYIKNIKINFQSISKIILFFCLWFVGFLYLFYNLLRLPLSQFLLSVGEFTTYSETWEILTNFLRRHSELGPINYIPNPSYRFIPVWFDLMLSLTLRFIIFGLFLVAVIIFILTLKRSIINKNLPLRKIILDLMIIISGGFLFLLGLFSNFLGQRVFQVIFISLVKYVPIPKTELTPNGLKKLLFVLLILSPFLINANIFVNFTVGSPDFIREPLKMQSMNFVEKKMQEQLYIFLGSNEIYFGLGKDYSIKTWLRDGKFELSNFDIIFWDPKVKKVCEYHGVLEELKQNLKIRNKIYNNGFADIYI